MGRFDERWQQRHPACRRCRLRRNHHSVTQNFDYVKKLGATQAFDYKDLNVVRDVIAAFKGKTIAGALVIGTGSPQACVDVVNACEGNKSVSIATYPVTFDEQGGAFRMRLRAMSQFIPFIVSMTIKCRLSGVRMTKVVISLATF